MCEHIIILLYIIFFFHYNIYIICGVYICNLVTRIIIFFGYIYIIYKIIWYFAASSSKSTYCILLYTDKTYYIFLLLSIILYIIVWCVLGVLCVVCCGVVSYSYQSCGGKHKPIILYKYYGVLSSTQCRYVFMFSPMIEKKRRGGRGV